MGWLGRLFGQKSYSDDASSDNPRGWFIDFLVGDRTLSGERVNATRAMRLSAVWACVRVRSEDVGKLPCILYRRQEDGGKIRATDHYLYALIRDQPNPRMTAFEFRQMMQAQLDLKGNAYALKEFDGRGRVVALWPIHTRVEILCTPDQKELFYRVTSERGALSEPMPAEFILHLRGMSLDGIHGLSPISYHRETIGLAIAAEKYGAAFFGNSAQPRGGIKVQSVLSPEAAKALRESWEKKHMGIENAHRIAIFDGGMEYVQTGMNNTDAQYLETRKMQNAEIWRIFRMPPHKVGDLEKATFSNIEQQSLEYVTDCLMSELVRWEQTLARDLLTEKEQSEYFFEFLVDALLRGDFKSRMEGYAIARNWGLFSADDCRDRENMNHLPDKKGEMYLQPLNMVEAGTPPQPTTPAAAKALMQMLAPIAARQEIEDAGA
jgi:HK97 family phage portal protein